MVVILPKTFTSAFLTPSTAKPTILPCHGVTPVWHFPRSTCYSERVTRLEALEPLR